MLLLASKITFSPLKYFINAMSLHTLPEKDRIGNIATIEVLLVVPNLFFEPRGARFTSQCVKCDVGYMIGDRGRRAALKNCIAIAMATADACRISGSRLHHHAGKQQDVIDRGISEITLRIDQLNARRIPFSSQSRPFHSQGRDIVILCGIFVN
jgi:hypothetical protein